MPRPRILLAAHPQLLTRVLRIVQRVMASFVLSQVGPSAPPPAQARSGSFRETRAGRLVEEQGTTCLADIDADVALARLQAALGPIALPWVRGPDRQVLSLRTGDSRDEKITHGLRTDPHGFSLHAAAGINAK